MKAFLIILAATTSVILSIAEKELLGYFVLSIMFVLFSLYIISRKKTLRKILITAFAIRLGLMAVQVITGHLPGSGLDDQDFNNLAQKFSENWEFGYSSPFIISGSYYYAAFVGSIYYFFGIHTVFPLFINVVLGVSAVGVLYNIAIEVSGNDKVAKISGLLACFFPTSMLYSALMLRDIFILWSFSLSFYYFVKWIKVGQRKNMIFAISLLVLSSALFGAIILNGVIYAFFYCCYSPQEKSWSLIRIKVILRLILVLAAFFVFKQFFLSGNKLPTSIDQIDASYFADKVSSSTVGRTSYLTNLVPQSMLEVIVYTPIRMVYFLFAPFPWMVKTSIDIFAGIDSILYIFLFWNLKKGLSVLKTDNKAIYWAVFLSIVVMVTVFSYGTISYGTGLRHRMKLLILFIPFASIGLVQFKVMVRESRILKVNRLITIGKAESNRVSARKNTW